VEKIVITTSRPEPDFSLIASLNALFPDCRVYIVFKDAGTVVEYSASCSSDLLMTCLKGVEI